MANRNIRIKQKTSTAYDHLFPETKNYQIEKSLFADDLLGKANPQPLLYPNGAYIQTISAEWVATDETTYLLTPAEYQIDLRPEFVTLSELSVSLPPEQYIGYVVAAGFTDFYKIVYQENTYRNEVDMLNALGASPITHEHTVEEVSGLQSLLDEKVDLQLGKIKTDQLPEYLGGQMRFFGSVALDLDLKTIAIDAMKLTNETNRVQNLGAYVIITEQGTLTSGWDPATTIFYHISKDDDGDAQLGYNDTPFGLTQQLEAGDRIVYQSKRPATWIFATEEEYNEATSTFTVGLLDLDDMEVEYPAANYIGYVVAAEGIEPLNYYKVAAEILSFGIINSTYELATTLRAGIVGMSSGATRRSGLSSQTDATNVIEESGLRTSMRDIRIMIDPEIEAVPTNEATYNAASNQLIFTGTTTQVNGNDILQLIINLHETLSGFENACVNYQVGASISYWLIISSAPLENDLIFEELI